MKPTCALMPPVSPVNPKTSIVVMPISNLQKNSPVTGFPVAFRIRLNSIICSSPVMLVVMILVVLLVMMRVLVMLLVVMLVVVMPLMMYVGEGDTYGRE